MSEEDWNQGFAKSIGIFLNGKAITAPNLNGERVLDDIFFIIFNAHYDSISFELPEKKWGERWAKIMDTSGPGFLNGDEKISLAGESIAINSRSSVLLRVVEEE